MQIGTSARLAISSISIVGILTLTSFMLAILKWQSHRVIHSASPIFCSIFLLGGVLLMGSVLVRGLEPTVFSCALQPWLFNIGFSISYGSLFAKTWRLHRIFNNKALVMLKITNGQLLSQLMIVIIFDSVLLAAWTFISPFQLVHGRFCYSSYSASFTHVFTALKGVYLLTGSVLTYQVRQLPSQFNESKFLGSSVRHQVF